MKTKQKTLHPNQAKSSLTKRSIEKFMKNRMALIGAVILIIMVLACICAPLLTPHDPTRINPAIRSLDPCAEHILGTDRLGRDIFARILYGGRVSIMVGVVCALGANLLGAILGCIAGYYGGKVDKVLVTIQEFISIFPSMLLILLCVGFMGQSLANILILGSITGWTGVMRIVRGRIMSLKQEPFVESCRADGLNGLSIMFHHLLPNTMGPIIVNTTMSISGYIMYEASLSYLGYGVPNTIATWGNIINAAKRLDIVQNEPMLWLAPGVAIGLFVLCINMVGDGLRDAMDATTR